MASERIVLAGGCFWGMQELLRTYPGVLSTRVGYTGGEVPNATYRNHGNHAEAIELLIDPTRITFRKILEFFFQVHDPTTPNRQGNDRGAAYRSAIYYTSDEQKRVAEETIADVDASGLWPGKVVTEIAPAGPLLARRARAPGLPPAHPPRLHLPLGPPQLDPPPPRRGDPRPHPLTPGKRRQRHRRRPPIDAATAKTVQSPNALASVFNATGAQPNLLVPDLRPRSPSPIASAGKVTPPWPS